ncbi:MAG: HAMP domain-containing sensor histidine kinase, partial [Myxococcota bacterium]|nr:HAMP domain-containing sensor histidine kinase [Myxococcota bacterium]
RTLRPLIRAADARLPASRVEAALRAAQLRREDLLHGTRWLDGGDVIPMLGALRDGCADDASWDQLCRSQLRESLGVVANLTPIRHPSTLFRLISRALPRFATGLRIEVSRASAVAVCLDVHIDGPDSPAFRIWREAFLSEVSCVVGMPAGRVRALRRSTDPGSDRDELLICYPLTRRVTHLLLGLVGGLGAAAALGLAGHVGTVGMVAVAALGAMLPIAWEGVLGPRTTERRVDTFARTLAQLDDEATGAVRELHALHAREREWSRREHEASAALSRHQQARLQTVERLLSQREVAVRGLSHDLRNPLVTIALLPGMLRRELDSLGGGSPSARAMLEDQDEAVRRMRGMLEGLTHAGTADPFVPLRPEWVGLRTLRADVDSRLAGLTWGRGLTGRAVLAPTAPDRVHIDRIALDRIVDNLLTNATKYTDGGTIRVELDGTPDGGLVMTVRDSGRGIPSGEQRDIFCSGGSNPGTRAPHSQGIGLSVVLRLVDQLGGKMTLQSALGEGSRFTVALPRDPPPEPNARARLAQDQDARIARVLELRPLDSSS